VDAAGPVVHGVAVGSEEVISVVCGCDHGGGEETTGYGFQEDIEDGIDKSADRAGVCGEVLDLERVWEREEGWAIAGLFGYC
jgi:hypothetical protein